MSMTMKEFADKLRALADGPKKEVFMQSCTDELAGRMLAKVRKKTPVGPGEFEPIKDGSGKYVRYKKGPKKGQIKLKRLRAGGNLRRGWNMDTARRMGNGYVATVRNNVKYASYVEYGHRQNVGQFVPVLGKRLVKPWVEGVHMLRISHDELTREAPAIIRQRLRRFLREGLHE